MSEWIVKPLGHLADFVVGQSPDSSAVSELPRGLPFLQGCAEFGHQNPEPKFYVNPPLRIAPKGSTLISVRAPVGTMNDADQSYGIGRGLAAVVGRERSNQFLRYAIELGMPWLHRRSQGSTFLAISSDDLRKLPVTIAEEPDICETAARIIALIDTQIEATEALIAKQELMRTGLMQDLCTRGIDEHGQLRPPREEAPHLYYQAKLGWLPRGWAEEAFGKRIEVIDPNPTHRYPDEIEEGIPICSTENFIGTDAFDVSFAKHVREATFVFQNNRCRYDPLDVIFARKGRIGLARRYGEDRKVFSHTVVTMKPLDQRVSRSWVLWLARSNAFLSGIVREMNSNSGVPTLGIEFIKSILVPFPPEPEHSIMATILDIASSAITVLENDLSKLRLQKSGLMHDLLTGKVSVEPLLESAAA